MIDFKDMQRRVLELVNSNDYHPIKPRVIAKQLRLDDDGERTLKKALKRLVREGRVAWGPKHLVMKVSKKAARDEAIGIFRRNSAGYGFVTPEGSTVTDRSDDIYIPKTKTADASNLDVVRIRISRTRKGSEVRISGRVIEVLERRTNRFVGTYRERGSYGIVVVDNGIFESGILVGDAGAKNCRVGDKVVIEMANFPSATEDGEGVIVEILGERGAPGVDTLMIIREFDLPEEFPESVLDEAREQAEHFDEVIADGRTDFTKETVVTIDPKTARDFDDAISLKRIENGHWQLGVHIADVSHFVPIKSDLDDEAYRRGTSVYLPDKVIPMLPELISNNLASLQPDRIRYTMSAVIEFTEDGIPVSTDLHRGAIKSAHRFNYMEIDEYLEDDKPWRERLSLPVFKLVREMHTLAMKLRKRRMDRGSIDLNLPEIKIDLDEDGRVSGAHTVDNTESHQVIEEFMLAANEAVAQAMADQKLYLIRRIHEAPSEAKLKDLTKFVNQLGIHCNNLQSRFEIKRVVAEAEDMPERHAIHFSILRAMQKAVYSPREIGHYALASDAYCHFTSPIRRYPDLVIHRAIGDLIDGRRPSSDFDRLTKLGIHCSDLERRAELAERELKKLKLLNFLVDKIGTEMETVVTGVEPIGLFAQGIELPAEGFLPVSNLPHDRYQFDRTSKTLTGFRAGNEFRLGDHLRIKISLVDPDQRLLEFALVSVQRAKTIKTSKSRKPVRAAKNEKQHSNASNELPWEQIRASGPSGKGRKPRKHK